jgi:aspartate/methionine/tyrosine aminotransferase
VGNHGGYIFKWQPIIYMGWIQMNDLAIVREQSSGSYNLALGEPFFLSDVLDWTHNLKVSGPFYYPLFSGNKELLEELQVLHPNKHVVIANGAKQAIAASLYAFKEIEDYTSAHVPAPHWVSYPTMLKSARLDRELVNDGRELYKYLTIDTALNNPDGRIATDAVDILDCAYSHQVYGYNMGVMSKHRVSIWSAAKLYGLSGLRIGYAVFDDIVLAQKAALFVEITTSGVSAISQQYMTQVLKYTRQHPNEVNQLYKEARAILNRNADMFNEYIAPYCSIIKGASTDRRGMFAYFKANDAKKFDKALKESNVMVVSGSACGEKEDGWYRMSLGHRQELTTEALEKLHTALK